MKKLEETFNIKPSQEIDKVLDEYNELEKLDQELSDPQDQELENYGQDMDKIAADSLAHTKDLIDAGNSVESRDAGSIYSAAVGMMKNAISAKNSKISAKLKARELKLKEEQLKLKFKELGDGEFSDTTERNSGTFANRNDILNQDD